MPDQPGASRLSSAREALDWRMRETLPRPLYDHVMLTARSARGLAPRSPGHGRLLPDFIIIGAAKGGTTSLYEWLGQHPFVEPASEKEVHYFDYNYYRGRDWYRSHFPLAEERRRFEREHGRPFLTGEASPSYLSHHWAPQRLARALPRARLIVTLRDPVERAYSQFQMSRREGEEELDDFGAAVDAEEARLVPERERAARSSHYNSWPIGCWSYLMRGRYADQLERWFELIPREHFHFLTLEQLVADAQRALDGVHGFLGLTPHRCAELKALHTASYEPVDPATRARLAEYFRPHNERLYELLGVDFGWGGAPTPAQGRLAGDRT
jgi:hypothetical protein